MFIRYILFPALLFLSFFAESQELFFTNLNEDVLLPSQECYKVLQDREGYIWFATDKGLCRYSSGHLTVFDRSNGLPEEVVYAIEMDKTGRVWFGTSANRIVYYENGRFKEPFYTKAYTKANVLNIGGRPVIYALFVDDPDYIDVVNFMDSYRIEKKTGIVTRKQKINGFTLKLVKSKTSDRYVFNTPDLMIRPNALIEVSAGAKKKVLSLKEILSTQITFHQVSTVRTHGVDVFSFSDMIYIIKDDLTYESIKMPGPVLMMRADANGCGWVGLFNKGVFCFEDIRTRKPSHHSLRNFSVTDICTDDENGVWCSTTQRGIFYCTNRSIQSFASDGFDHQMELLKAAGGKLFVGGMGKLSTYDGKDFKRLREEFVFPPLSDMHFYQNKWYIGGSSLMLRANLDMTAYEQMSCPSTASTSHFASGSSFADYNGKLYAGLHVTLAEVNKSTLVTRLIDAYLRIAVHIIPDESGNMLLGGQGLYSYEISKGKFRILTPNVKDVKDFVKDRNGAIWIATKSDGIFVFENGKVRPASEFGDLKSIRIFDMDLSDDGSLWVGTNKGIFRFITGKRKTNVYHFDVPNGIPSNEVYKIAFYNGDLWFSVFEGVFRITEPSGMNSGIVPRIKTRSVSVNRKPCKSQSSIYIADHNSTLSLSFDFLSYKQLKSNKIHYRITGNGDTLSALVSGSDVTPVKLDPGSYKLIARAVNFDGTESLAPEIIYITVAAPFYMTWWFFTLCFLLLIVIFLAVLRFVTQRIRRREKAKTRINKQLAEFQMTALQAQMNPHFIFNAINTIQGYILQRNEEEAYKYLAKFSKLIRIVLHHSQEKELLLSDELEMLNLYIELEQLRFDHSFDFELKTADNVDPDDTYLPGMLLQPYVENAIWHGLINLQDERRGKLDISFERENEYLKVSIEDNGIGREKAKDYRKNTSHKSVSMTLTSERIQLMKSIYDFDRQSVRIIDKTDENGNPSGTIVLLHIPFIN